MNSDRQFLQNLYDAFNKREIEPGPTDTGWMSAGLKQELLSRFPKGRIGQPEDAARLVVFLASDDADWITGQIIHSEGGFMRI